MDSSNNEKNKRYIKEKRRSRVKSMRNALIGFLFFWILFSFVLIGYLAIRINSLQEQIDSLKETKVSDDYIEKIEIPEAYVENNNRDLSEAMKVYLSFDDGPSTNTAEILDILDDYGVKATFFVQGKEDDSSKNLLKRIADEGHTIGMHSYSHSYGKIYSSLDSFAEDIQLIKDYIFTNTGIDTYYYRFPGGSSNGVSKAKLKELINYLNDNDIKYFDWNVSSQDAASPPLSPDTIVENVMKDVVRYKTSIVLLHDADEKDTTVKALPLLIEKLRDEGVLLLPINDDTTLIQHVRVNDLQ